MKQPWTLLWTQHVVWTRQAIVSTLAGLPDAQTAIDRLMRNQQDIGDALGTYYGASFAAAAAKLLKEHIQIALALVKAAASGDSAEADRQDVIWHRNAAEIAAALASVNLYWPAPSMQRMLYDHLRLTKQEAVARIKGQWAEDVSAFDEVLRQALMMADVVSAGLLPGR